jgi:hypothetical protein
MFSKFGHPCSTRFNWKKFWRWYDNSPAEVIKRNSQREREKILGDYILYLTQEFIMSLNVKYFV